MPETYVSKYCSAHDFEVGDYADAMRFVGAEVHDYETFGDYQGTWIAYVTYNGRTGYVSGSYGSCSGCDHFEAELGWGEFPNTEQGKEDLRQAIITFGAAYLNSMMDQTEAEKEFPIDEKRWFDQGDKQAALYVRQVRNPSIS